MFVENEYINANQRLQSTPLNKHMESILYFQNEPK